jgi:hypothetical protein
MGLATGSDLRRLNSEAVTITNPSGNGMQLNLAYNGLQDCVAGVLAECDKSILPDLHMLPYSRYSQEYSTVWWLRTDKAPTAFKHGKFVFGRGDRFGQSSDVIAGFQVERGVKAENGHPTWRLGRDWKWHDFLGDMKSVVPEAVDAASKIIGQSMTVTLSASIEGTKEIDRVCFDSSGDGIAFKTTASTLGLREIQESAKCESWQELHSFIQH